MKNEYTITKRLMRSWAKGGYFNLNSTEVMKALFIICCGVALLLFTPYLLIYFFRFVTGDGLKSMYPVIFGGFHTEALLFVFFFAFLPSLSYSIQYWNWCKNYNVKEWQRATELTEDEIIVKDHRSIFKYQYRTIRRVKVRGNVVHIFLKSGTEIIIHKDAFVSGSWDECKKLISQKSRVKIK